MSRTLYPYDTVGRRLIVEGADFEVEPFECGEVSHNDCTQVITSEHANWYVWLGEKHLRFRCPRCSSMGLPKTVEAVP